MASSLRHISTGTLRAMLNVLERGGVLPSLAMRLRLAIMWRENEDEILEATAHAFDDFVNRFVDGRTAAGFDPAE